MHEVLVNRLGGLSLPRKSVVRLTERLDMTLDVYRGRKTTNHQIIINSLIKSFVRICEVFQVNKIKCAHIFAAKRSKTFKSSHFFSKNGWLFAYSKFENLMFS